MQAKGLYAQEDTPTNEELLAGRGGRGESPAHGARQDHRNEQAGAGPGGSGGRRRSGDPAHLPQHRHKAASRTSAVLGGLWGEAPVHELNLFSLWAGPEQGGPEKRAGRGWQGGLEVGSRRTWGSTGMPGRRRDELGRARTRPREAALAG